MIKKTWENYKKFLMRGIWHLHTSYTDGENNVSEFCEFAQRKRIPLLAFTEHVRKELDYEFEDFMNDIFHARIKFKNVIILSGCEANILKDGSLDVSDDILKIVDYPIIANHQFQYHKNSFLKSLKKALKNPYVNTWAHPGLNLSFELNKNELYDIMTIIKHNNVLIEINKKYNLPKNEFFTIVKEFEIPTVQGNDAHTIYELNPL